MEILYLLKIVKLLVLCNLSHLKITNFETIFKQTHHEQKIYFHPFHSKPYFRCL